MSAQAVSKWERGLNFPDLSLLEPLGDCLGLTVSELLSGQRGGEPREELLLDSLRLLMGQAGRKLRRWRRLAQVCLGVLLALALGAGLWFVKNHTELLPRPDTEITHKSSQTGSTWRRKRRGTPACTSLIWRWQTGPGIIKSRWSCGRRRGWSGPGLNAEACDPTAPRHQMLGFSYQKGRAVHHGTGGLHGPGDLADHAGGSS